jgi:hypothetical protein
MQRFIVATPAGRERYLKLLSRHVLASPDVDEWHLWENCRTESDRAYLHRLAAEHPKVRLVSIPDADGTNEAISRFYRRVDDPDALYLRMDDDIVYLEPDFFPKFRARALAERGKALWFSPFVVNNAICTWLLKYFSSVEINAEATCQATCWVAWRDPYFAEALHRLFLRAVAEGKIDRFRVADQPITFGRFSINAIGFFGAEKMALGDEFCPPDAYEEEWISAVLPVRQKRYGKVFGDVLAAHFSFFPQEKYLLSTDILGRYYALHGLPAPEPVKMHVPFRKRWRFWRKRPPPEYRLGLGPDDAGAAGAA